MKPMPNMPRNEAPTTAYIGRGRTVRAAPLSCPYCLRAVHAGDFEVLDGDVLDGDVRLVCSCGRDLLTIEQQP